MSNFVNMVQRISVIVTAAGLIGLNASAANFINNNTGKTVTVESCTISNGVVTVVDSAGTHTYDQGQLPNRAGGWYSCANVAPPTDLEQVESDRIEPTIRVVDEGSGDSRHTTPTDLEQVESDRIEPTIRVVDEGSGDSRQTKSTRNMSPKTQSD